MTTLLDRLTRRNAAPDVQATNLADGTVVHLRRLTESEYSLYESDLYDPITGKLTSERYASQRRRFLALALCDENGQRIILKPDDLATMDPYEAIFLRDEYTRLFPRPRVASVGTIEKKSEAVPGSDTPAASA